MKKLVMFITIFVSVLLTLNIYNVKALNNPIITNDYLFPNEDDIYAVAEQYNNYSGLSSIGFKVQCWHTNSFSSEVYCFMGNISFNSWLVWNNGNYSNIYNTDGFGSPNYNWYWDSDATTYYSMAIYKWNSDTFTWSALCETVANVCPNNYIVSNGNQFPISFITYNSNILNSPMFRTDITYTKDEWVSPYFNLVNPRPSINLPSYLTGYKKISLTGISYNDVRYYALSGLSSGSVFVPYDYVLQYGGGLQYQNSAGITDWSSAVEDYYVMDDEQFVRYDFDLNNYPNAEFVFYTKYFYFEGTDFPSVDIYVPDDTYTSPVVVSENNQGGNDFTFTWENQEGNVISSTQETIPVNYNPLLPSFLQEFSSDTFGLTSIITSPLTLISSITSSTCSSISIPMPFSNNNLVLPCMSDFYRSFLGNWFDTYQSVTFGIISYWVIVRIFNLIKDFKNPEHDEVEVLDL